MQTFRSIVKNRRGPLRGRGERVALRDHSPSCATPEHRSISCAVWQWRLRRTAWGWLLDQRCGYMWCGVVWCCFVWWCGGVVGWSGVWRGVWRGFFIFILLVENGRYLLLSRWRDGLSVGLLNGLASAEGRHMGAEASCPLRFAYFRSHNFCILPSHTLIKLCAVVGHLSRGLYCIWCS